MTPSRPGLPRHFGERAAVIEMFFTPASARASAREFFLTGESITGVLALRMRPGTWSSTIVGQFADVGREAALKRLPPALPSQKRHGHALRNQPDENQPCSTLPVDKLKGSRPKLSGTPMPLAIRWRKRFSLKPLNW